MTRCRGCGAPILWLRMASSGKAHPVNAAPLTVLVVDHPEGAKWAHRFPEEGAARVTRGCVSHFATCPAAGKFRHTKQPTQNL